MWASGFWSSAVTPELPNALPASSCSFIDLRCLNLGQRFNGSLLKPERDGWMSCQLTSCCSISLSVVAVLNNHLCALFLISQWNVSVLGTEIAGGPVVYFERNRSLFSHAHVLVFKGGGRVFNQNDPWFCLMEIGLFIAFEICDCRWRPWVLTLACSLGCINMSRTLGSPWC